MFDKEMEVVCEPDMEWILQSAALEGWVWLQCAALECAKFVDKDKDKGKLSLDIFLLVSS